MNSPESIPRLSYRDEDAAEAPLHRFETREMDEQYSIDLAQKACDALHRFALDREVVGLAELESDITERALSLVEDGTSVEDAVSSILTPLQQRVQDMMRSGKYAFRNEDIYDQFGKSREQSLIGDIKWILERRSKTLPENQTRQLYTNADLDKDYAIDFIEAIWQIDPQSGELSLERVDFVQKKTTALIPEKVRAEVVRKHREFMQKNEMIIAELRVIEATEEQMAAFKAQFNDGVEAYLANAFESAYTGDSARAEAVFADSLAEFRKFMESIPGFTTASRPIRRAYIEQLSFISEGAPQDEIVAALSQKFEAWKREWLNTIPEKKVRELSPIRPVVIRSILSSSKAGEDIVVLSDLTQD